MKTNDLLLTNPLKGKTILVTRAKARARDYCEPLAAQGAQVYAVPLSEAVPLKGKAIDDVFTAIRSYEWVIFTSAKAVSIFMQMAKDNGFKGYCIWGSQLPKIATVGGATARALRKRRFKPEFIAADPRAEILAAELAPQLRPGSRILVPQARGAEDFPGQKLRDAGATLHLLPVFETHIPEESKNFLIRLLERDLLDFVVFTGSANVTKFHSLAQAHPSERRQYICVGPMTAERARDLGLNPVVVTAATQAHSLMAAIVERVQTA